MQTINITLPDDLARDLKNIPQKKRDKFIREAVSEKLSKKKQSKTLEKKLKKSLGANYEYYKKVGKEWEVTEVEGWPD